MVSAASLSGAEVALGVFTHRTTYLPDLLDSLKRIGDPACVVVCADGPINTNMARLWEAFKRTRARYWVFLDDDIEFLGGDVLGDCVKAMVRHRWNKTRVADELGLSRVGLRAKLTRYGLERKNGAA